VVVHGWYNISPCGCDLGGCTRINPNRFLLAGTPEGISKCLMRFSRFANADSALPLPGRRVRYGLGSSKPHFFGTNMRDYDFDPPMD